MRKLENTPGEMKMEIQHTMIYATRTGGNWGEMWSYKCYVWPQHVAKRTLPVKVQNEEKPIITNTCGDLLT